MKMSKAYAICLSCGNVQVRTDIIDDLGSKQYTLLNRNICCPKCHKTSKFAATKDIKCLKKALNKPQTNLDNRINKMIG